MSRDFIPGLRDKTSRDSSARPRDVPGPRSCLVPGRLVPMPSLECGNCTLAVRQAGDCGGFHTTVIDG